MKEIKLSKDYIVEGAIVSKGATIKIVEELIKPGERKEYLPPSETLSDQGISDISNQDMKDAIYELSIDVADSLFTLLVQGYTDYDVYCYPITGRYYISEQGQTGFDVVVRDKQMLTKEQIAYQVREYAKSVHYPVSLFVGPMEKDAWREKVQEANKDTEWTPIKYDGMDWYIKPIDSTHFQMTTTPDGRYRPATYHVAQMKDENPRFYNAVVAWLKGRGNLEGQSF